MLGYLCSIILLGDISKFYQRVQKYSFAQCWIMWTSIKNSKTHTSTTEDSKTPCVEGSLIKIQVSQIYEALIIHDFIKVKTYM